MNKEEKRVIGEIKERAERAQKAINAIKDETAKAQLKIEKMERNAENLRIWFFGLSISFFVIGSIKGSYTELFLLGGAWVIWWIIWLFRKPKTRKNMPI